MVRTSLSGIVAAGRRHSLLPTLSAASRRRAEPTGQQPASSVRTVGVGLGLGSTAEGVVSLLRRSDVATRTRLMGSLQSTIGNASLARLVQRCGPTPCNCSPAKRAAYDNDGQLRPTDPEGIQRLVDNEELSQGEPQLESALANAPALTLGARGPVVALLQSALKSTESDIISDGKFGPRTESAVRTFQQSAGLTADGAAGRQTLTAIGFTAPTVPGRAPKLAKLNGCTYEPGEKDRSRSSDGEVAEDGEAAITLFDFTPGSSGLKPTHQRRLVQLVKDFELNTKQPKGSINVLTGFADCVASDAINTDLRTQRAEIVRQFFLLLGANSANTATPGAAGNFLADNGNAAGRAHNRAVQVVIGIAPNPLPKPTPKPTPAPERDGCSEDMSSTISSALSGAQGKLNTAIALLASRPLVPLARDALWLTFRATSDSDATQVNGKLAQIANGLPSAAIECSAPGVKCSEGTKAFSATFFGQTITVCSVAWQADSQAVRERTLIHEGAHTFAGMSGVGEKYMDDQCEESDLAGSSRGNRLQNADSYACLVMLIASSGNTDLGRRVEHSKGADMAIIQRPKGTVRLGAPASSTQFALIGLTDVGIKGTRWIFKDTAGRKYLLLADGGKEVVSPDAETAFVSGITLGDKTRALLRQRAVTDTTMSAVSDIPEVGQKLTELPVTLAP